MITKPSRSGQSPEDSLLRSSQKKVSPKWRRKLLLGIGGIILINLGGGLFYIWLYLQQELTPKVEKELANFLNRPVNLGQVESFRLGSVRFGESEILAVENDPAKISMEGLNIRYNIWVLLTQHKLKIDVTAIEPNLYLQQGKAREWLLTPFDKLENNYPVQLKRLQWKQAKASLVVRSSKGQLKTPIQIQNTNGELELIDQGKLLNFKIESSLDKGKLTVSGVAQPATQSVNLSIQAHQLPITEVDKILSLPLTIKAGTVNSNLDIHFTANQLPQLQGIATLNQVMASFPELSKPITQIQGDLRLKGEVIHFDQVKAKLHQIQGNITGNLSLNNQINLAVQTQSSSIHQITQSLSLPTVAVPIKGKVKSLVKIQGKSSNPQISIQAINDQKIQVDQFNFAKIEASLSLDSSRIYVNALTATPTLGGQIQGNGKIKLESSVQNQQTSFRASDYHLNLVFNNLPPQPIAKHYIRSQILPSTIGLLTGKANIVGNFNQSDSLTIVGTATLPMAQGLVNLNQFSYSNNGWQASVNLANLSLSNFPLFLSASFRKGDLSGQFKIKGEPDILALEHLQIQGKGDIELEKGKITASDFHLSQGQWWGNFATYHLKTEYLSTTIPSQYKGLLQSEFTAQGDLKQSFSLKTIRGQGKGQLRLPYGLIQIEDFRLAQGQWQTNLYTQRLNLKSLLIDSFNLPANQFTGSLNLKGNVDNNLSNIRSSLQGSGQGKIQVSQGAITVNSLQLNQGHFHINLMPQSFGLSQFSKQLKGTLEGNLSVQGNLNKLNFQNLQAEGNITLSKGLPFFARPLSTSFQWSDQILEIKEAKATGLKGKGKIEINAETLSKNLENAIESLDLQLAAKGLDIKALPLPISAQIGKSNYGGEIDFTGTIAGNFNNPQINGNLSLIDFYLADLNFEKALDGHIQSNQRGIQLALAGLSDKLKLQLNNYYQPLTFFIKHQDIQLTGLKEHQQLYLESQNLPLSLLRNLSNFPLNLRSKTILGSVSGNVTIDLNNFAVVGRKVVINQPQLDWLKGDKLTGTFRYFNDLLVVKETQLQIKNSRFQIDGKVAFKENNPSLVADINIITGKLEDILESLHLFEVSDFNRGISPPNYQKASDLYGDSPVVSSTPLAEAGLSQGSLEEHLAYFKFILEQQARKSPNQTHHPALPSLAELKGDLKGTLSLKMSSSSDLQAQFNLFGQRWQWANWQFDQLQATGKWQNGTLIFSPLQITSGTSFISLAGRFESYYQSGQLQVVNVPLEPFKTLMNVPENVNLNGLVNADLKLGGSRINPLAQGMITLNNLTFNQVNLQQTYGQFSYRNARLHFNIDSHLGTEGESVKIKGELPYQLAFATIKPQSDQFSFDLRVKDEGLALLNLLTQEQLTWQGGKGDVNLAIFGQINPKTQEINNIDARGLIEIADATLQSAVIPEKPLTQVNGIIDVNLDRIHVKYLTGVLSGGEVAMSGSLPILKETPQKKPLTASFANLGFKLPDIYEGGIRGQLAMTGSVLSPQMGGHIELYQGKVLLGEGWQKPANPQETSPQSIRFNQLQISLGDNIRLINQPILNFSAVGHLILHGDLNDLHPTGQIYLTGGQVNLLASQLRLVGNNNTVQFFPESGLDPYLNLNLATSVPETTSTTAKTIRIDPSSSEINDPFTANQDSFQTVRIEANVKGFISQLKDNISFNSEPKRSEKEILTLLGGSLANLEDKENTGIDLANLAGTIVLGTVQNRIGSALGLSEFRIFPTPLIEETGRARDAQVGIAAEASIDVWDNLSFSVLKILNSDRPPQWGIRYRVNENLRFRGSSNFEDDSRGMIEYEHRF